MLIASIPPLIDAERMLNQFMLGAIVLAGAVAGLLFMRFWRKTHDRLFAIFAIAFWLLSLNWLLLSFTQPDHEFRFVFYLLRLLAFMLILYGIYDKNRAKQRP